jgi:hypothetical protein
MGWRSLTATLALTAPVWAAFLLPTLDIWAVPDGDGHLTRAIELARLIRAGSWYPRWLPEHAGGYGYPALNFYGPATYYATVAIAALPAVNLYSAYQAVGAIASLGVIIGAHTLAWRVLRDWRAALLAGTAIAYAPYVVVGNLFDRGALPEVEGIALTLWLLVACHGLWTAIAAPAPGQPARSRVTRWWWTVVVVSTALLVTHNLSALLAAACAAGWLAALTLVTRSRAALGACLCATTAGALGASITAFFWAPALLESSLVQIERMQRGQLHYRNWFIEWPGYHLESGWGLQERSPWTAGWPFDLHLVYTHAIYGTPRMSLWQALALGAAVVVFLAGSRWRSQTSAPLARAMLAYGLGLALVTYALLFDWFLPAWEQVRAVRTLQFPMRLLGPTGIGTVCALAATASLLPGSARIRTAVAVVTAAAIALSGGLARPLKLDAEAPRQANEDAVIREQSQDRPWSYGETGEFLPKTADWVEWHEGEARGFWLFERVFPESSWLGGRVRAWDGRVAFHDVQGGALWTLADVTVDGAAGGTVAFHQFYFPGWRAWIDGVPVATAAAPEVAGPAITPGFVLVNVPPGDHRVTVRLGLDATQLVASVVSLATLLCISLMSFRAALSAGAPRRVMFGSAGVAGALVVIVTSARIASAMRPPRGGPAIATATLADVVQRGDASISSLAGGALAGNPFVQVRWLSLTAQDRPLHDLGPTSRRWLYAHPPSEIAVETKLTAGGYLQTALAMDPQAWTAPEGDGVRFVITVAPASEAGTARAPTAVLDTLFNPRAFGEHRRWADVVVDLTAWAGQRVRIVLRTEARFDASYDWVGWAEPVVVELDRVTAARLTRSAAYVRSTVLKY